MNKIFIIVAPNYDEKTGGSIALHKLCHIINQLGIKAYLCPAFENRSISILNYDKQISHLNDDLWRLSIASRVYIKSLPHAYPPNNDLITKLKLIKRILLNQFELPLLSNPESFILKTNPHFDTPVIDLNKAYSLAKNDNVVVIYPEIMSGNPLEAKHVVRWLLHDPGFHTKKIYYEPGELYFRFTEAINPFIFPGSHTSNEYLTVTHFPLHLYNQIDALKEIDRKGSAYCLRKGISKKITHDLHDSVCIDELSHSEISEIFKRVKYFYCYDTLTTFVHLAVVCGCKVILMPDSGILKKDWGSEIDQKMVSYGVDEINMPTMEPELALNYLRSLQESGPKSVQRCLNEIDKFFN